MRKIFAQPIPLINHYKNFHNRQFLSPDPDECCVKQIVYNFLCKQTSDDNYAKMRSGEEVQTGAQLLDTFWRQDDAENRLKYNEIADKVKPSPVKRAKQVCLGF